VSECSQRSLESQSTDRFLFGTAAIQRVVIVEPNAARPCGAAARARRSHSSDCRAADAKTRRSRAPGAVRPPLRLSVAKAGPQGSVAPARSRRAARQSRNSRQSGDARRQSPRRRKRSAGISESARWTRCFGPSKHRRLRSANRRFQAEWRKRTDAQPVWTASIGRSHGGNPGG
jgi:hypothetical protein